MRLHVTTGNTKIGETFNLSFPPITTCRSDLPCAEICYAHRLYQSRPSVRKAWDENYKIYLENPLGFWLRLQKIFDEGRPERFRLFVGGDFPDVDMVVAYMQFAVINNSVDFLVYTKRFEWLPPVIDLPGNLSILVSMWDGFQVNGQAEDYPKAWFRNAKHPMFTDERIPEDAIICESNCVDCGYQCYGLRPGGKDVVLKLHGAGSQKYSMY